MSTVLASTLLLMTVVLVLTAMVMGTRRVLAPERPVTITVNKTLEIEGRTGEKLLTILKEAKLPIPSACAGAGTCGLCRVTVPADGGEPLPTEAARLTRAEMREGMRLACQVVVRGPLTVSVPEAFISAKTWDFRVAVYENAGTVDTRDRFNAARRVRIYAAARWFRAGDRATLRP